jgi:general secretion pathway protein D
VLGASWQRRLRAVRWGCAAALPLWSLAACSDALTSAKTPSRSAISDAVIYADLRAHAPVSTGKEIGSTEAPVAPMLFPGSETDPALPRDPGSEVRVAASDPAVAVRGGGVEINFDGADINTVAKSLLEDTLGLNFVVDPRVQGTVTLASVRPIARKDVLPVFESVLRMSNAAIVRAGDLIKIVPLPEASGDGAVSVGAGQPGFGVSIVPVRYASAAAIARTAENFLTRPGAIRADESRNILLIQGTSAERQSALDVVAAFDVEWLRNQSVGVYPIKSTSPETVIHELERVMETGEGGQAQGLVKFQPIARMNAVMAVARNPKLLERITQWVQRLDRSDTSGTSVRIYHLKNGRSPRVAKILNEIFGGQRGGATVDTPGNQAAPGTVAAQSRLDALGTGSFDHGTNGTTSNGASAQAGGATTLASASGRGSTAMASAFGNFSARWDGEGESNSNQALASSGASAGGPRAVFQNVRISADTADNSIVVYSNQEDYRIIEQAIHDLDRPQMQVAIDAMVAEVTLTDQLQFGVQYYLSSQNLQAGHDQGSIGLLNAAASTAQTTLLSRVVPGFNLLLGSETQPRLILNALSSLTAVKVLSAPSLVVVDNQPALLQVGDEVPVTTGTATVLSNSGTPIVNTIEMRNTGVILKVMPHVHANGTIQLEIEQEISNVTNQAQTLTPTIAQRRIHSTVEVASGQTVLLGGLISEREEKTNTGIPGIQSIKFLGDLLGNKSGTQQRSEIVVFIKPKLIRNGLDARNVAEEFRDRLQSMRSESMVIKGTDLSRAAGSAPFSGR